MLTIFVPVIDALGLGKVGAVSWHLRVKKLTFFINAGQANVMGRPVTIRADIQVLDLSATRLSNEDVAIVGDAQGDWIGNIDLARPALHD